MMHDINDVNRAQTDIKSRKMNSKQNTIVRRKIIGLASLAALSPLWIKPVVNSVVLPAHAQTSMCMTDMTVGGPLAGNASGATSCQAACEFEAQAANAQLCEVRETQTATGTDCACDLDLP